jgi:hypothetical protein
MRTLCAVIAVGALSISCSRQPEAAVAAAAAFTPQPHSNLAQLMRGIPFTFANIVFDAQTEDPGVARKGAESGGATAQFQSVYGGWQEVENSALALAEASTLVLVPGRTCENGKPVPVQDETYRQAAEG